MDINKFIAIKIRQIPEEKGFCAEQVAKFLGKSKGAYSNLENGKVIVSIRELSKMATFYSMSMKESLLTREKRDMGSFVLK